MAIDSEAPISHSFKTMTITTEAHMKETDKIAKNDTMIFIVANSKMIDARATLIVIPLTAFLKNAFSASM